MRFTENMLTTYAAPLSETENTRCKNAIRMIRDALKNIGFVSDTTDPELMYSDTYAYSYIMKSTRGQHNRQVKLLVQGSYANNTNVKQNSDVDIAVILESTFRPSYRNGVSGSQYGFLDSTDSIEQFKDDVEAALRDYFTYGVIRKNKSIKVEGNSYRVDADTVPCMRYRDYKGDYSYSQSNYVGGIVIVPDQGREIINYPEQHIINGKRKNTDTHQLYKKMVRIMKKMRYLMEDDGYSEAKGVSSFVLESLLWNIPNDWYLENAKYRKVFLFKLMLDYLIQHIAEYGSYREANGIKFLSEDHDISALQRFVQALSRYYDYE